MNHSEMEKAKALNIQIPEPQYSLTKCVFRVEDIKRGWVEENKIILEFYDEASYSFEYEKGMWDKLEKFFIDCDKEE